MLDFLARRLAARLAEKAFDAVSPGGKRRREEAERGAEMFGYGGMSERERHREAVHRLQEDKVREREMLEDTKRLAAIPESIAEAMGLGGMTGEERYIELVRLDDERHLKWQLERIEAEADRLASLPEFSGTTEQDRRLAAGRRLDAAGFIPRWERHHEVVEATLREAEKLA
jgi:hypothetical protein